MWRTLRLTGIVSPLWEYRRVTPDIDDGTGPARQLHVIGETHERADAARNRQKILAAASRLLADHGTRSLSLDEVAREAGVGVGTVYRRFGSRSGVMLALLDSREREFQQAVMTGPPPLGPGAPPAERARAFLHGLLDRRTEQWHMVLLLERSGSKENGYGRGPHAMYRAHLIALLREANPDLDVHYVAEALLAQLNTSVLDYQLHVLGFTHERVKAGIDQQLSRLL